MYVEFAQQAEDTWGGWTFGDLAVALCRAVEVVGPSADVQVASVRLGLGGAPLVSLRVSTTHEVNRLRYEADSGEYVAHFRGDPVTVETQDGAAAWEAEVNGIRLFVAAGVD